MKELSKLAALVAFVLTGGRVIEFRFVDELPLDKVRGLAFRDGPNAVVMVDRYLGDEQKFKTIIHEIAHCRQDWNVLMDVKNAGKLSGRYLSEVNMIPKERHQRSYELTREWLAMGDKLAPGGNCSAKLAALGIFYLKVKA